MAGETVFQALLVALALILVQVIIGLVRSYRTKGNGAKHDFQEKLHDQMLRDIEFMDREVNRLKVQVIDLQRELREIQTHPAYRIYLEKGDG